MSTEQTITAHMSADAAYQLAQFCKRVQFSTFYELTEAHLSRDERTRRAYLMVDGLMAIMTGLNEAGHAPR
ncbi:hypothetical protein K5M36_17005 [Chromobacterium vaccinii]|nr:hypothetical protein [Chromobacterium vaccinii]